MSKFNQQIILSRIHARGALQKSIGESDRNKIIKTNASGKIDPSLIDTIEQWDDRTIQLLNSLEVVETASPLIIISNVIDGTLTKTFRGFEDGQTVQLMTQFHIDAEGVLLHETNAIEAEVKTSNVDPLNKMDLTLYADGVQVQTHQVDPTASYADYIFPRASAVPFPIGTLLELLVSVDAKKGDTISVRKLKVGFDALVTP